MLKSYQIKRMLGRYRWSCKYDYEVVLHKINYNKYNTTELLLMKEIQFLNNYTKSLEPLIDKFSSHK